MEGKSSKTLSGILLKVVMLLPLLELSPIHCGELDMFRTSCPYNRFCTVARLMDIPQNATKSSSCCFDCFCDKACHAFGDCCPDAFRSPSRQNNTKTASCNSIVVPYGYITDAWITNPDRYRMIDKCSRRFTDTEGIISKCEEEVYSADRSYDDVVIVSGHNNVIYRNNYCALCHGVKDAIRWHLKVITCRDKLESLHLPASQMKTYIMENCLLVSERPDTLPLNSRLIPCRDDIVSECSDEADTSGTAEGTIAGCENGSFMPYSNKPNTIFKNVLCYQCNRGGEGAPKVCSDKLNVLSKTYKGSVTKLLHENEVFNQRPTDTACGESEIMDYNTNACRTLYCPPFEAASYGVCRPIATPARMAVMIRTVFWSTKNVTVAQPIKYYNESIRLSYSRKLRGRFDELDCRGISLFVSIHTEQETNRLLYILLGTIIGINEENCTIGAIGNVVRSQASIKASWLINGEVVKMKGQNSFYRNFKPDTEFLMMEFIPGIGTYLIDEFVLCPYFEIDMDMYNDLLTKAAVGTGDVTNLTQLSMKTETMRGVYVLSQRKLAICVGQYLYISNAVSQAMAPMPCAKQVVLVFLYIVLCFSL